MRQKNHQQLKKILLRGPGKLFEQCEIILFISFTCIYGYFILCFVVCVILNIHEDLCFGFGE